MAKMIRIRNVSDAMHRAPKARAALGGLTLSDCLVRELTRVLERPTPAEMVERLRRRRPVRTRVEIAELIRREREAR